MEPGPHLKAEVEAQTSFLSSCCPLRKWSNEGIFYQLNLSVVSGLAFSSLKVTSDGLEIDGGLKGISYM